MDHRMRAPNHGLSQLAASFIACPRPGIPRVPLLRLTSSKITPGPVHRYNASPISARLLDDPNHPNCQIADGVLAPYLWRERNFRAEQSNLTPTTPPVNMSGYAIQWCSRAGHYRPSADRRQSSITSRLTVVNPPDRPLSATGLCRGLSPVRCSLDTCPSPHASVAVHV